jgi:hypothetical protein
MPAPPLPPMKTLTRVVLVFFAGLALAGCASKTARIESPTVPKVAASGEQLSRPAATYWLQRELNDKSDRALGIP